MNDDVASIGDYAIIGDCRSAALISRDGSLDWLCWPRFDSPAVFARILDPERGGNWRIRPRGVRAATRRYVTNTNVLEARFETESGVVTLTDFMPLATGEYTRRHLTPDHAIIRLLRCDSGRVEVDVRFEPRPDFGFGAVGLVDRGSLGIRLHSGHGMLSLHSTARFHIERGKTARATIVLTAGETSTLTLTYSESSPEVIPLPSDAVSALERTVGWWQKWWNASNRYEGPYRGAIARSVLTLKLLEFPASGAFVAALTTSLPERVGGSLNWDYRYCWLRDAAFILEALCGTGFVPEAEAFAEWLLHATRRTQPKLMVMYDVYGNRAPREKPLEHLSGHRQSGPVRVGNMARDQSQIDTYGEVVAGVAILLRCTGKPADRETSKVLVGFGIFVCDHWRDADAGIWEDRGAEVVHTHSRLLCWVATDALLDLHARGLIRGVPVERFNEARAAIRRAIETESWNDEVETYTSEPGRLKMDASLLLLALHGFHAASSDRARRTHACVWEALTAGGSLMYRNLPDDGTPIEGAFGICGFWRVQYLADGGGTLAQSVEAFEALMRTANDVGLFAEETDPRSGTLLGNFPQAFTHVGLINAALAIERRRSAEGTTR